MVISIVVSMIDCYRKIVWVKGSMLVMFSSFGGMFFGLVCNWVVEDESFIVYIVFSLRYVVVFVV